MKFVRKERGEKRNLFTVTVEYSLTSNDPDGECYKGVGQTTNISRSGIGMIMNCPVDEGQCVALYGSKLSEGLVTGQVKWCLMLSRGIYRVGLSLN
jgi:hypothetical protein